MSKLKILIIFILFHMLSINLYSQNILSICIDSFLQKLKIDSLSKAQISFMLNKNYKIHPELVYHYLNYYCSLSEDTTIQNKMKLKNLWNQITLIKRKFIYQRSIWAQEQILKLKKMEIDDFIKNKAINRLEILTDISPIDSTVLNTSLSIDSNKLNYYMTSMYRNVPVRSYDSSMNYTQMKVIEETKIINHFLNIVHDKRILVSLSAPEVIDDLYSRWYLFEGFDSASQNYRTSNLPCEILVILMQRKYLYSYKPKYNFGLGYTPINTTLSMASSIFISGWGRVATIKRYSNNQFTAFAGYKYFFKKYKDFFSYLDLQLIISDNIIPFPSYDSPGFNTNSKSPTGVYYNYSLTFRKSIITTNTQSYFLRATTPIEFLSDNIVMEIGMQTGINIMNYRFEYDYQYQRYASYINSGIDQNVTDRNTIVDKSHNTVILPIIDVVFRFSSSFSSYVLGGPSYISLLVVYNLYDL